MEKKTVKTKQEKAVGFKTTEIIEFKTLNELLDKMDGKRKTLNLSGAGESEWIDSCYVVHTGHSIKAIFLNSWFLELRA